MVANYNSHSFDMLDWMVYCIASYFLVVINLLPVMTSFPIDECETKLACNSDDWQELGKIEVASVSTDGASKIWPYKTLQSNLRLRFAWNVAVLAWQDTQEHHF